MSFNELNYRTFHHSQLTGANFNDVDDIIKEDSVTYGDEVKWKYV